ncbi:MAG: proton-conducting transporter membrane subunit [Deltaproteobacteria bacterium]
MIEVLLALVVAALVSPLAARARAVAPFVLACAPAYGCFRFLRMIVGLDPMPEWRRPWVEPLGVELALRVDGLSALFAVLILGIGTLIVIYGGRYLAKHRDLGRFYALLFTFMASMLGLVLADDAITLFVFWEGTSLSSYLLIGFDHEERSARVAARKALLVTGTGGLALLGGFVLLHHMTGTWALSAWIDGASTIATHPLSTWALALVLLGALTKSAQFPFHFWLPAAMAGPTPVSAYLHSATMVKAGVFLLARLSPLWSGSAPWTYTLVAVGSATMLLSAWSALRFSDLKSVLAYTTTMALGLLVLLLGFGDEASVVAAMTYLVVHALYKGALFMVAGSVDHGAHTRDLDKLSGLRRSMKITTSAAVLACASMAGLPPFLGFVGKEVAYEANLGAGALGFVALAVGVVANAALVAGAYVLGVRPFFGAPSTAAEHAHDDVLLAVPPVVLAALGLVAGLTPAWLDGPVGGAAGAILAGAPDVHLSLWHGLTPALGASLGTYALGGGVAFLAVRLRRSSAFAAWVRPFTELPPRVFERALLSLVRIADRITDAIYVGKLRRYVMVVLGAAVVGLVVSTSTHDALVWPGFDELHVHEAALLLLLVVSSIVAAFAEPAMRAIIAVGISGYCVAIVYLLFGAPDVAMTQFAIETLTVILVVLTLLHLPNLAFERPRPYSAARDFVISAGVGTMVSALLLSNLAAPLPARISEWYLQHSVPDAHGRNVVNVILVDFRGFDTWGEITVLTIAGLGVFALLRRRARTDEVRRSS